jgi:hypothetical protein
VCVRVWVGGWVCVLVCESLQEEEDKLEPWRGYSQITSTLESPGRSPNTEALREKQQSI